MSTNLEKSKQAWEESKSKLSSIADEHRKMNARLEELEREKGEILRKIPLVEIELSEENLRYMELEKVYEEAKQANEKPPED